MSREGHKDERGKEKTSQIETKTTGLVDKSQEGTKALVISTAAGVNIEGKPI